ALEAARQLLERDVGQRLDADRRGDLPLDVAARRAAGFDLAGNRALGDLAEIDLDLALDVPLAVLVADLAVARRRAHPHVDLDVARDLVVLERQRAGLELSGDVLAAD